MANPFLGIVHVVLLVTGGPAVIQGGRPPVAEVRMVCDQTCSCWRTRNRESRPPPADRPDLACPPPVTGRPARGSYNGHYRAGPAIGIGFDSRDPVREFPF